MQHTPIVKPYCWGGNMIHSVILKVLQLLKITIREEWKNSPQTEISSIISP